MLAFALLQSTCHTAGDSNSMNPLTGLVIEACRMQVCKITHIQIYSCGQAQPAVVRQQKQHKMLV